MVTAAQRRAVTIRVIVMDLLLFVAGLIVGRDAVILFGYLPWPLLLAGTWAAAPWIRLPVLWVQQQWDDLAPAKGPRSAP